MKDNLLNCFTAYDIRGQINVNINVGIAYRIGRAVAQHLHARTVVVGYDARATSPEFASAFARGVLMRAATCSISACVGPRRCIGPQLNLKPTPLSMKWTA